MGPIDKEGMMQVALDLTFSIAEDETKSIMAQYVKLNEEVGELAVEVLIREGLEKPEKGGDDGILGECVDIAQIAMSIFTKAGGTPEDFMKTLLEKNMKWNKSIQKRESSVAKCQALMNYKEDQKRADLSNKEEVEIIEANRQSHEATVNEVFTFTQDYMGFKKGYVLDLSVVKEDVKNGFSEYYSPMSGGILYYKGEEIPYDYFECSDENWKHIYGTKIWKDHIKNSNDYELGSGR